LKPATTVPFTAGKSPVCHCHSLRASSVLRLAWLVPGCDSEHAFFSKMQSGSAPYDALMFGLGLVPCPCNSEEETMRFAKILSVCLGLLFVVGLQLNVNSEVSGAGNSPKATVFLADGGHPLPPPMMADGGHPLP